MTTDEPTVPPGYDAMAFTGHAAAEAFFVGFRLAALRREHNLTPEQQARNLGLILDQLAYLCLCRMPGRGEPGAVERIAERVGTTLERLADILRIGEETT